MSRVAFFALALGVLLLFIPLHSCAEAGAGELGGENGAAEAVKWRRGDGSWDGGHTEEGDEWEGGSDEHGEVGCAAEVSGECEGEPEQTYIVMFREYLPHKEHPSKLCHILREEDARLASEWCREVPERGVRGGRRREQEKERGRGMAVDGVVTTQTPGECSAPVGAAAAGDLESTASATQGNPDGKREHVEETEPVAEESTMAHAEEGESKEGGARGEAAVRWVLDEKRWRVQPRPNRAKSFDSDFVVVKFLADSSIPFESPLGKKAAASAHAQRDTDREAGKGQSTRGAHEQEDNEECECVEESDEEGAEGWSEECCGRASERSDVITLLRHSREVKHVLADNKVRWKTRKQGQHTHTTRKERDTERGDEKGKRGDTIERRGAGASNVNVDQKTRPGRFSSERAREPIEEEAAQRSLLSTDPHITHALNTHYLWDKGHTGGGIRVAVFDTGLGSRHPHFRNIREQTDWTNEHSLEDQVGHGTFVAGVIAGTEKLCPGLAPDAELYIFRVFTNNKVSYTSWFLDAFNYAIHSGINILNLSIGGPDYMDVPFVEKVWEMLANNIIVVSAIGNDGPLFGTLNNPADMAAVVGVGGITFDNELASWSSRGMTTWELPAGYGRVKPDIVTFGKDLVSSRMYGGCRTLSGTSVASPVAAGAAALLASSIPSHLRHSLLNPAVIKQALIEGADLLPAHHGSGIFEQGAGRLNLVASYEFLRSYTPRVTVVPAALDLTQCPYMWPFCSQPLFFSGMPLRINTTVLNGMGVTGRFVDRPRFVRSMNSRDVLDISFSYPHTLWPWAGYLAIELSVREDAADFEGTVEGVVRFAIVSPIMDERTGSVRPETYEVLLPLRVDIIPTPAREKRILWDQFHSLHYPRAFFPRDHVWSKVDPFDWNGDHIHTNYRSLYLQLQEEGYYVDVLGAPYTCFDAQHYGVLLVVDPEEEFFQEEVEKLYDDVTTRGLSLAVFADWYNTEVIEYVRFFDENTQEWWVPETGGCNLPALNDLLRPFNVEWGSSVYEGELSIGKYSSPYLSGSALTKFPAGGLVVAPKLYDQVSRLIHHKPSSVAERPVLGMFHATPHLGATLPAIAGRVAAFGDSSCFDDAHTPHGCSWIVSRLIRYASDGTLSPLFVEAGVKIREALEIQSKAPKRRSKSKLKHHSRVVGKHPQCASPAFEGAAGVMDPKHILWEELEYLEGGPVNEHQYAEPVIAEPDTFGGYVIPYLLVLVGLGFLVFLMSTRRAADVRRARNATV